MAKKTRKFKYKGFFVAIQSFADSWDKKIVVFKGQKRISHIYSYKHMEDAVNKAKSIVNNLIR